MPPHTTYFRITRNSVLQLRIFTEHPLDAGQRWLIHPTDPALPKVIKAIRHLILPKLREENARKYGAKGGVASGSTGPGRGVRGKKRVKDVVVTDDFEVSLFLTELPTRHSLLVKHKTFNSKKGKLAGNSTRLTDASTSGGAADDAVVVIPEEEEDDDADSQTIENIPQHRPSTADQDASASPEIINSDSDSSPSPSSPGDPTTDDKKKLNFKTTYDGFSIWGWTLVLLIKRKDDPKRRGPESTTSNDAMMGLKDTTTTTSTTSGGGGKENNGGGLMEEWISTQALGDVNVDDEYVGD